MNFKRIFCFAVSALAPLTAFAADKPADAEPGQSPGPLEEVVVSEFRRTVNAELDSSVTVLNRETVQSAALQHFEELIALVPNMNFSGDGSRARYFQMRGIGELEQYEGTPNPSVGFIVDDIDLSGVGGISTVFDLQQVDVLRGPQATRFGASALAGLVYVQSAEPAAERELNAELLLGQDDTLAGGIAVGGGLGDSLSGRFSLHRYRSNGFYDNVTLGIDDSNERDELTGRGKLLWEIGASWEAQLSLLFADFDNGYDAWSPENGRTTFSDNPGRDTQKTRGGSLKFSGPIGKRLEFVSITGLARSDVLFSFDGEWGSAAYWAPYGYDYVYSDDRERESLTQEFRLLSGPDGRIFGGRSSWVLGLYASRLEESDDILSAGLYDDSVDAPLSWCAPCLDRTTLESDYEAKNWSVFGRLDTELSERTALNAGVRLERWEADYADEFVDHIYAPDAPVRHDFHPSEDLWGGDISLNHRMSEHTNLYLLLARGYKAGGFNPSLARALGPGDALGPGAIAFDPEALLNYEAGVKGLLLGGRMSFQVAAFRLDRSDMQVRSSAQFTDNPNDFIFITSNAEGHAYGLETSLTWQPGDRWRLFGSLGLLQSEIDAYALDREADIEGELIGREFAHAPPYTLNIGAIYTSNSGWFGRIDLNAVGSFYFDYSHDERSGSRQVVNLKVGREWAHWAVYGWARNLFDEDYYTRGFSFGLEPPWFERTRYTRLGDPRQIGLTIRYRY